MAGKGERCEPAVFAGDCGEGKDRSREAQGERRPIPFFARGGSLEKQHAGCGAALAVTEPLLRTIA